MIDQLPKKKLSYWNLVWVVVFILGLFVSTNETGTSVSALFSNFGQFTDIFFQMAKPDWSFTGAAMPYLIETIKMAVLGTVIGSAVAFVYSLLIARNIIKNRVITGVLRFIMNIIRTIPDLLLGSIFVAVVGIGPVAGIAALSVFTFGVVVKLFYEAIETIDNGPSEAIQACGGNKFNEVTFAVMPQVLPYFISYTLYAFELNIRASSVLGYIGAGGIGLYLKQTLDTFQYGQTGMITIVIFLVVLVIDVVSAKAREALMR
ncbi:MAG: phosphonate ABC transporter, permease protein PhnE [Lactobacillus sp.]|nr:phosphonate ABC transporter, permease protein PhnE [Lactobacillus sp.]